MTSTSWLQPGPARPRPGRPALLADAVLAVAAALAVVGSHRLRQEVSTAGHGPLFAAALVTAAALTALPLAARRRYPLAVFVIVAASALALAGHDPKPVFFTVMIAAYSAAAYSPYRIPAMAALALVAAGAAGAFHGSGPQLPHWATPFAVLIPIAAVGNALWGWRQRVQTSAQRLTALQEDHAGAEARAVQAERARIARELHDVVTHNVSVMVIQAGAAAEVLEMNPALARQALRAVQDGGRAAMTDLRHVMGLLATTGDTDLPDDLVPQPGLGQLATLIDSVRDAGVTVTLDANTPAAVLPSGTDLAAYRVVQEALTNILKYAPGTRASIRIDYHTDEVTIEVNDTGATGRPAIGTPAGGGRGLLGLRERLALYSGTLHAGPSADGGFQVMARIPLEAP